ncbi:MAG: type II toxin-antitoxin system VapC family toxin [bacterium]
MRYMLDTNICIYLIKKRPEQVLKKLRPLPITDIAISSISVAELEYGVAKSSQPERNRDALSLFLAPLEIVLFDQIAAFHYGVIRASLESKDNVIGSMDMLIASHAISLSATLVTNNLREFERVPGLSVENWL